MRAELITVGDELCRGEIVNTNASWLAAALWEAQVTVGHIVTCRDLDEDMREAIQNAAQRSDLVLISGGLGPTMDDLTVDLMAALARVPAVVHEPSAERMRQRFAAAGSPLVENAIRQVRHPEGSIAYPNSAGLAPGFELDYEGATVICLPGPPRELKAIYRDHLEDRIRALRLARGEKIEHLARKIFRVFGRGESQIANALEGLVLGEGASLHYQVKFPETLVKVVIRKSERAEAETQLAQIRAEIHARLGSLLYGEDDDSLAASVVRELLARKQSIATAESCTGGMIASLLTDLPGVSECYPGGAVTYSNAEKTRQLGVSEDLLRAHGAVSEPVVLAMAEGIRERVGADWGVAVSGIAGPGGGSEEKPVGTVWIAVAGPEGRRFSKLYNWPGARDQIRALAAYWALNAVRRQLLEAAE